MLHLRRLLPCLSLLVCVPACTRTATEPLSETRTPPDDQENDAAEAGRATGLVSADADVEPPDSALPLDEQDNDEQDNDEQDNDEQDNDEQDNEAAEAGQATGLASADANVELPDSAPPHDESTPGARGLCNAMGYCWVQPLPFGDRIGTIHGTPDAAVVFAVSEGGALLEHRDSAWQYHEVAPGTTVQAVHVVDENEIWAGTSDGLYRHQNGEWKRQSYAVANSIAFDHANQLWIATGDQVLRLSDGQWHDETPNDDAQFVDVVAARDGVWAIGLDLVGRRTLCQPYHHSMGVWAEAAGPPADYGLGGPGIHLMSAGDDVYMNCIPSHSETSDLFFGRIAEAWEPLPGPGWPAWAAPDGTLYRQDTIWQDAENVGVLPVVPTALWGTSSRDVWLGLPDGGVGRFDGSALHRTGGGETTVLPLGWDSAPVEVWTRAGAAWGSAADDVWRAPFEHFDGSEWTQRSTHVMTSVHGSATDNVWFTLQVLETQNPDGTAAARLAHWDGDELREVALPDDWAGFILSSVFTFGPTETWVGGSQYGENARLARYDGRTFTTVHEEPAAVDYWPGYAGYWTAIEGASPDDIWALSGNRLLHFNGTKWDQRLPASDEVSTLLDIAVRGQDVRVLTDDGLLSYAPGETEPVPQPYGSEPMLKVAYHSDQIWLFDGVGRALTKAW